MASQPSSAAARLAAAFTGLLVVAFVSVALAAGAAPTLAPAAGLHGRTDSLPARTATATLELFALETELGRERASAGAIAARRRSLARERASTHRQLAVARRVLHLSDLRLADLLRTLYERPGDADPLAIVLAAASLEEALTGLDNLDRAAGQARRVLEQARSARARLAKLDARLRAREAELAQLAAAAEARAQRLAELAEGRRDLLAGLRRQELGAARIGTIEAQARRSEQRASELEATAPALEPTTRPGTLTVSSTGYSLEGRTASGMPAAPGVVAVDPAVIPLGTRLLIPGYGEGIAADTGGAVQGNEIDLWFPTQAQALAWGRRTVRIGLDSSE